MLQLQRQLRTGEQHNHCFCDRKPDQDLVRSRHHDRSVIAAISGELKISTSSTRPPTEPRLLDGGRPTPFPYHRDSEDWKKKIKLGLQNIFLLRKQPLAKNQGVFLTTRRCRSSFRRPGVIGGPPGVRGSWQPLGGAPPEPRAVAGTLSRGRAFSRPGALARGGLGSPDADRATRTGDPHCGSERPCPPLPSGPVRRRRGWACWGSRPSRGQR